MLARLLMTLDACLALISNSPAIALTRAPLVMGLAVVSFIAFIVLGGNILLTRSGNFDGWNSREVRIEMA